MSTEKIKKELVWIRQFIHKKDDENVVIRDANGKDIASWINRVDAAIATPPAAQRQPLTDQQIGKILDDPNIAEAHQGTWPVLPYAFARAIEQAHGIGKKK